MGSTHVVQGLQEEHLLTTVLMEEGAETEAEPIQRMGRWKMLDMCCTRAGRCTR